MYSCCAIGAQPDQRITFHNQRKNRLAVRLTEVDPFGNYSSPHYKGAAVFYKVARGQLEWEGDKCAPVNVKLLGDPVCKLPLTLPKVRKTKSRDNSFMLHMLLKVNVSFTVKDCLFFRK